MNKKGFTLIELLAVIVILAIIALIAVPSVLNIIEDSRKGAAEASARNIVSAAKTYYMQQSMKGSSIDNINLEEDTLKYDGDKASKGYIVFDANGKTTSKMYINGYCVEVAVDGKVESEKVDADECTIETEELKGTAYALVLDNSTNEEDDLPLIFVRSETEIKVGDTYNSDRYGELEVLGAYTGFETEVYSEYKDLRNEIGWGEDTVGVIGYTIDTPWVNHVPYITSVIVEDKVRFASLVDIFSGYPSVSYMDLGNIDTSKNTSFVNMFYEIGHEWSTDNCHLGGGCDDKYFGGTSVVIEGLDKWKTSNVTDMEGMFYDARLTSISDISGWDTSNVTNMPMMFLMVSDIKLDLTNWNVDKVTNWSNFNTGNEDNIKAPAKFQTTEE